MNNVYNDLAIDLVTNCNLNMFEARKIVAYLSEHGHIDYNALKEYYLENDE